MLWATNSLIQCVEKGWVPDRLIRYGIRRLLLQRLHSLPPKTGPDGDAYINRFIAMMDSAPIAVWTDKANEQHYEVPAAFFGLVLGPRRKYSSCYWPEGVNSLAAAEIAALEVTAERANLANGQRILELGCGWGSLTLWMAERYPDAEITAVSNSNSQRRYIEQRLAEAGRRNVHVITCDMNEFDIDQHFDRIVSIEMFEHMRNWRDLFARATRWLVPGGELFLHVFCHRAFPYAFVVEDDSDWMSQYFFSGGIMPSYDLPTRFEGELQLAERWSWNGRHYAQTAEAWLAAMDAYAAAIRPILAETYGEDNVDLWRTRWRIFFMACAELFGYRDGNEWFVGHYRFTKRG